jgi:hypothetical protein
MTKYRIQMPNVLKAGLQHTVGIAGLKAATDSLVA